MTAENNPMWWLCGHSVSAVFSDLNWCGLAAVPMDTDCELECFCNGIANADPNPMMDIALSILALIAGGLTLELFTSTRPPLSYPESRSFHVAVKTVEAVEELQIGNPS